METKAYDCAVQHIKTFHDQAVKFAKADFGEPCQTCLHAGECCSFDWLSIMEPLLKRSTVKIKMLHQVPPNIPGRALCKSNNDLKGETQ